VPVPVRNLVNRKFFKNQKYFFLQITTQWKCFQDIPSEEEGEKALPALALCEGGAPDQVYIDQGRLQPRLLGRMEVLQDPAQIWEYNNSYAQ
jgi:hypothetical protein